jgi:hypothetical protein
MKDADRIGKVEKLHCPKCNHETEHSIRDSYKTNWDIEDAISGGATHDFLRCNGCKSGTYRVVSWSTDDQGRSTALYPARGRYTRKARSFPNVPWESLLPQIYRQTITAHNSGLLTLAGAGVRLLIEGICKQQGVTKGPIIDSATGVVALNKQGRPRIEKNLEGRINGMADLDIITKKQCRHLHEIRFLGNDAAHEPYVPEADVVGDAIDIVEQILDQFYEQPEKAKQLASRKRP